MMSKPMEIEKEEKILCPKCLIYIDLSLNNIKMSNGYTVLSKVFEPKEFSKLSCQKCELGFTYICCVYCNKKIYMKLYQKDVSYNGLNGHNISCPYKSCGKIFYFTKCPKCQFVQKQKKFIKEGDIITCLNSKCKFQYSQVNCPIKYCSDLISFEKPKIFTNYPIGIMLLHKNEINIKK